MMPIIHKIIFKHIFHKRKSLYMLPKLYMHVKKEVLCCKFLIFNNCNFVCFRVFLLYTSIESTCICKSFRFFLLRSESNLHFPHPAFGRSGCRLSNYALVATSADSVSSSVCRLNSTVISLPDVSDVWRWPNPVKTLNVPFLLQNPQWNQRMNSHEPCI